MLFPTWRTGARALKTMSSVKPKLEGAGYKESKAGLHDLGDLDAIRGWAREVAKTVDS